VNKCIQCSLQATTVVTGNPTPITQEPRRSIRIRQEPERYGFLISEEGDVLLMDQDEPVTYIEAITGLEYEKCLEAMKSEMDSMYENQVLNLVETRDKINPIGCKWVFKKKKN
jgi:cyanophycinase-like exopeptidase